MISILPGLLQTFTVIMVSDPDELGDDSRVSQRFPGYNKFNTYRLRDYGVRNERRRGVLSRLAVRREGALTIGSIESRLGTEVGIVGNGVPRLFLTFPQSGVTVLRPGVQQEAVSQGTQGLVYRGLAGTCLLTSNDNHRVTVQIDESRLLRSLTALLDDQCPGFPEFDPGVDWAAPSAAPIARLAQHIVDEAADPDGLFSVPPALETITDTLVHLVLARLPHSLSDRLRASRSPAIPRQLRHAEAFMAAHAAEAISIADIAAAAGCGTRALQLAFRRFRDTTPLGALQEVRLQAIRAALAGSDLPAAMIARAFGFSNASRFRVAYLRRFGELPRSSR